MYFGDQTLVQGIIGKYAGIPKEEEEEEEQGIENLFEKALILY